MFNPNLELSGTGIVLGLIFIHIHILDCIFNWTIKCYNANWISKYRFWLSSRLSTIPIPTPLLKLVDKRKRVSSHPSKIDQADFHLWLELWSQKQAQYLKFCIVNIQFLWIIYYETWAAVGGWWKSTLRIQAKKMFLALWKWVQINWEKRVLRHWIRTIILVPSQNSRLSW